MFFIRKKLPRGKALGEPLLYNNHKVPVTRRELLGAGLRTAPALVVGPAWLGMALRAGKAHAAPLCPTLVLDDTDVPMRLSTSRNYAPAAH